MPATIEKPDLERQAAEVQLNGMATRRASADPLPGPLKKAFTAGSIKITDDISIRKFVAHDWRVLDLIESPLLEVVREMHQTQGKGDLGSIKCSEEQLADLCWIMSRPSREVREVESGGKEAIRARAIQDILDSIDAPIIQLMENAIIEQFLRGQETALHYRQKMEQEGEVRFFREPPEETKTASAGG